MKTDRGMSMGITRRGEVPDEGLSKVFKSAHAVSCHCFASGQEASSRLSQLGTGTISSLSPIVDASGCSSAGLYLPSSVALVDRWDVSDLRLTRGVIFSKWLWVLDCRGAAVRGRQGSYCE